MPGGPVNNCWLREVSCREVAAAVFWPSTIAMRKTDFGAETAAMRPGRCWISPFEASIARAPARHSVVVSFAVFVGLTALVAYHVRVGWRR